MASMLIRSGKPSLALTQLVGKKEIGIMFLPGFMSVMNGTKSLALQQWCKLNDRSFISFDYRGVGESEGEIESLKDWIQDAADVFQRTNGPQVLVGSSMGAFMMMHVARRHSERVHAMLGVAPAFPFAEKIHTIDDRGDYDPLPASLIANAERESLFTEEGGRYRLSCPLHVMHGTQDEILPWKIILDIFDQQIDDNGHSARFTLCKGRDHRLSSDDDLRLLFDLLEKLLADGGVGSGSVESNL